MKILLLILCFGLTVGTIPARGGGAAEAGRAEMTGGMRPWVAVAGRMETEVRGREQGLRREETPAEPFSGKRNGDAAVTETADRIGETDYAGEIDRTGETAQGPQLVIDEPVHDFGDVARKGGDVTHEFVFRNAGDKPLVVVRVVTSCSCVKAAFPKRPLAPGQSGVIRITYQPHKSEPGAFNKVVQIFSNAGGGSRDIVTVQGRAIEQPQQVKIKNGKMKIR